MARLVIVEGPDAGGEIRIEGESMTFGRDPANQAVLSDSLVSKKHARIDKGPDNRYSLLDMGSSNGTLVNGVRVTDHRLNDGDRVAIGRYQLRFEDDPAPAPVDNGAKTILVDDAATRLAAPAPVVDVVRPKPEQGVVPEGTIYISDEESAERSAFNRRQPGGIDRTDSPPPVGGGGAKAVSRLPVMTILVAFIVVMIGIGVFLTVKVLKRAGAPGEKTGQVVTQPGGMESGAGSAAGVPVQPGAGGAGSVSQSEFSETAGVAGQQTEESELIPEPGGYESRAGKTGRGTEAGSVSTGVVEGSRFNGGDASGGTGRSAVHQPATRSTPAREPTRSAGRSTTAPVRTTPPRPTEQPAGTARATPGSGAGQTPPTAPAGTSSFAQTSPPAGSGGGGSATATHVPAGGASAGGGSSGTSRQPAAPIEILPDASHGVLHVLSKPTGLKVFLNEEAIGTTNMKKRVPPGKYYIRVEHMGRTETDDIKIKAEQVTTHYVDLMPPPAEADKEDEDDEDDEDEKDKKKKKKKKDDDEDDEEDDEDDEEDDEDEGGFFKKLKKKFK